MKKSDFFKYVAIGAGAMYAYSRFRENPHQLGGPQDLTNKVNQGIDRFAQGKNINPVVIDLVKSNAGNYIHNKMNRKRVN